MMCKTKYNVAYINFDCELRQSNSLERKQYFFYDKMKKLIKQAVLTSNLPVRIKI